MSSSRVIVCSGEKMFTNNECLEIYSPVYSVWQRKWKTYCQYPKNVSWRKPLLLGFDLSLFFCKTDWCINIMTRIKGTDYLNFSYCWYLFFQNVFSLDFGHFQRSITEWKADFVYIFQQWAFLRLHVTCDIKRRTQKLGQHILRYISRFQHSERDNSFAIAQHLSQKKLKRPMHREMYRVSGLVTI